LEAGVLVGSGARILGPVTVGKNARVGAGSIVLKDVPSNATVAGVPARVVKSEGQRVAPPLEKAEARIETLESMLRELQQEVWRLREATAFYETSSGSKAKKRGVA
jgi:serine O-acetyltransferase